MSIGIIMGIYEPGGMENQTDKKNEMKGKLQ